MDRGTIDGFVGSWASGFDYLAIDGIPVPCDNGPKVRALDACFGGVTVPGHWLLVQITASANPRGISKS
jgi:hypothetical protein